MSSALRSKVSTRRRAQRLNPGQYIAPPAGATVRPPQPFIHDEWDHDSPAAIAAKKAALAATSATATGASGIPSLHRHLLDQNNEAKVVPPFSGAGNPALVARRNHAATATPLKPLMSSLLPYPIRRAAARSMLYGGVRTSGLNAPYPDLAVTRSEKLTLPTLQQERRDMAWDAADSGLYLQPINMHPQLRQVAWHNRCLDLDRRLRQEMEDTQRKVYLMREKKTGSKQSSSVPIIFNRCIRFVQPHSSTLSIEPYTQAEWQRIRAESAGAAEVSRRSIIEPTAGDNNSTQKQQQGEQQDAAVSQMWSLSPALYTQRDAFMPFQTLRPHGYGSYSPAGSRTNQRGRHAQMELVQERLNRKGFGWKSLQNRMWQQDTDTHRYTPDRGYTRERGVH